LPRNPSFAMIWKPNVTVAAVVQRDGKFLLVEEETEAGLAFNQPAGHLEEGESLIDAVVREALEETAYHFVPTHLVGIYNWKHPTRTITYLRLPSVANCGLRGGAPLDDGIVAARWLTLDEVRATQARHRSPLILRCIEDWLAGKRYPLDLLVHYD
jgi:8-oxo-dGTP pyrophosphatase MutT (NUDIX family)